MEETLNQIIKRDMSINEIIFILSYPVSLESVSVMIQITKTFVRKCVYLFQSLRRTLWYNSKEHSHPLTLILTTCNFIASIKLVSFPPRNIQEYSGLFLMWKKNYKQNFHQYWAGCLLWKVTIHNVKIQRIRNKFITDMPNNLIETQSAIMREAIKVKKLIHYIKLSISLERSQFINWAGT